MAKKAKMTLEKVGTKVEHLVVTVEKLATLVVEGFEEVRADMADLKHDVTDVKKDTAEMKVDLKAQGKAIDKDAVTLINHESRIKKLEHAR